MLPPSSSWPDHSRPILLPEYPSASVPSSLPSSWTRQPSSLTCKGSLPGFPASAQVLLPVVSSRKQGLPFPAWTLLATHGTESGLLSKRSLSLHLACLFLPYGTLSLGLLTPHTLKLLRFSKQLGLKQSQPLSTAMPLARNILPSNSCLSKPSLDFGSQQKWNFLPSTLPEVLLSSPVHNNFFAHVSLFLPRLSDSRGSDHGCLNNPGTYYIYSEA